MLAFVATAAWTHGLGEGLDGYAACALSGSNASLSIFVDIARCDTNAGPVEMGRSTTFTLDLPGSRLSLGWSGTGTLAFRGGERAIAERLADAGVPIATGPLAT